MRLVTALVLSAALATSALAQDDPKPAVTGVIQDQINAFLADDFATAFTFASPNIQGLFRDPDTFGVMVRRGYPMVWRPADVTFGDTDAQGGLVRQKVVITDTSGGVHVLEYEMIPQGETWKINGVRLLPAPQVGA